MAVIELENVSKKFSLTFRKKSLIKDFFPAIFRPGLKRDFWALQEINFKVREGETIGIIGNNGAGKTTLLSIIAGISYPTEGKVKTKGRVFPLLTLGAGFHRELSGEDNIYLNGLLLGLSLKDIKSRMDKITEFSELGSFIKLPVYTYSSGMLLRLGFSIAVEVDFDILILDEILSVGDISFQEKCIRKIEEFIASGKTILVSSQSLGLIKDLCQRVLFLENGRIKKEGFPDDVIVYYRNIKREREKIFIPEFGAQLQLVRNIPEDIDKIKSNWGKKLGNTKALINAVNLLDGKGNKKDVFKTGESLIINVDAEAKEKIINPHLGIAIFRKDYNYCQGPNTKFDGIVISEIRPQNFSFALNYKNLLLKTGDYKISVAIWDEEEKAPYAYHCAYYDLKIESDVPSEGLLDLKHNWVLLSQGRQFLNKKLDYKLDKYLESLNNFSAPRGKFLNEIFLCDNKLRRKEIFLTLEYLGLVLNISQGKIKDELFLGAVLLKSDGLICHQTGAFISSSKKGNILLEYPIFPILRGEYMFLVFIAGKNQNRVYDYSVRRFTVLSKMRDHGVVYMEHSWKISGLKWKI